MTSWTRLALGVITVGLGAYLLIQGVSGAINRQAALRADLEAAQARIDHLERVVSGLPIITEYPDHADADKRPSKGRVYRPVFDTGPDRG